MLSLSMAAARTKSERSGWISFIIMMIAGLTAAFFVFIMLAMGECLPRDGSDAMHTCDTIKQREFWLYPTLVFCLIVVATWLQMKQRRIGLLVALASGFVGAIVLWLVEALMG